MRWMVLSFAVSTAACGAAGPESPTSPTSVPVSAASAVPGGSDQTQAQSASGLPFQGSFTGGSSSSVNCPPTCPPTTLTISGTSEGTATHLGRYTATSVDVVNLATQAGTGTIDFTAANGDHLYATTAGGEESFTPPNISTVRLTATITGGTGRFAGSNGTFTVLYTQEIDFANASASTSGHVQGYITLDR